MGDLTGDVPWISEEYGFSSNFDGVEGDQKDSLFLALATMSLGVGI